MSLERLTLAAFKALSPRAAAGAAFPADLPPLEAPFEVLVVILNKDTQKKRILACQTEEKASKFVKLFNLVSAFTTFDDEVSAAHSASQDAGGSAQQGQFSLASKADKKRVELWVQNFVLNPAERRGEAVVFAHEGVGQWSSTLRVLSQYFKECVTALVFTNNSMNDQVFQASLHPGLLQFQNLQKLELTSNHLTAASLATLGYLFQSCQGISDLNLASNYIGGASHSGGSERDAIDFFLYKFFTELQRPRLLNLSYNSLTDDCLHPVVKYVFANYECRLEVLNLENNRFSPFGSRTLLKAYAISPSHSTLSFKYGPLPLSLENLRAGFVTEQDAESIVAVAAGVAGPLEMSASRDS